MEKNARASQEIEQAILALPETGRVSALKPVSEIDTGQAMQHIKDFNLELHTAIKDAARQVFVSITQNKDVKRDKDGNYVFDEFQLRGLIAQTAMRGGTTVSLAIGETNLGIQTLQGIFDLEPSQGDKDQD